jgi:exopolysaccharide biosynthesis polyprenyl glycosylphosphotransferase
VSLGYASSAAAGVASALMLVGLRSLLPLLEARAISDNILVLGREDLARTLCTALQGSAPRPRTLSGGANGHGNLDLDAEGLKRLVRAEGITRIVVVGPEGETSRPISDALLECRLLGVKVEDGIELYQRLHGKLWLDALEPGRLAFSDGFRLTPSYRVLKRAIDMVGAITLLVLAAPLMAVIALAVRLESAGPIFFRQVRVGQFGRTFTLYKFRSMREDAEKDGPTWAAQDDQRVTKIGRFLRRSHFDELPQAWNVLKGELSFVGPRPERPCFVEMLRQKIDYFDLRLYVKPGITGWAQVCYPYCSSVEDSYEKVQYDLYYARHASLELDVRILLRTGIVMLAGRGR